MPTHRISHAVSRFVKAFQRKKTLEGADCTDSSAMRTARRASVESLTLSTTTLPTVFFKQVKTLLERTEKLHKQQLADAARFSSASTRASMLSPSSSSPTSNSPAAGAEQRSSLKRQHMDKDTTRASVSAATGADAGVYYLRLASMLTPGSPDASTSTRTVAVTTAVETLLQLWDLALQLLQADELLDASTKAATLTLLQAIAQRREFDVVLHALASGACSAHHLTSSDASGSSRASRHRASSVRLERAGSFRVAPVMAAMPPASKKSSRRRFLKKPKHTSAVSATLLCALAQRYLSLHHASLQLVEDAVVAAAKTTTKSTLTAGVRSPLSAMKQTHELLAALLAVSFVRVPWLREQMLATLQREMATRPSKRPTALPAQLEDASAERALPLFTWHRRALAKCSANVAPFNCAEFWTASARFVGTVLGDGDSRLMFCGHLVQQLTAVSAGNCVEWQRVPGFAVLAQFVLWETESLLLQQQTRALETTALTDDDSVAERANVKAAGAAHTSLPQLSSSSTFFLTQSLALLVAAPQLLHPMLLTIFTSTNYMLPHHVSVCLAHLERVIAAAPAYFRDEPLDSASDASADVALLTHVFTCLLASEHFAILKATQLFLLAHFHSFSHELRAALTRVFAAQFRRLFLHWSRDVRYCFFHVLLYLTYAGNRIVLCARSDECVLGAEAAQLFEIPGLVRTPAMAAWDVFDAPLHALLTRYNRMTKQSKSKGAATGAGGLALAPRRSLAVRASIATPMPRAAPAPAAAAVSASTSAVPWVDEVPLTELARSVPEYRRQVQTYFQCAKQFSLHEAVPVPVFYVKGSAPHS